MSGESDEDGDGYEGGVCTKKTGEDGHGAGAEKLGVAAGWGNYP